MKKNKRNDNNVYILLEEYEQYYNLLENKNNNLYALYNKLKNEESNLIKKEHECLLELKYAQFSQKGNINIEKENHRKILLELQDLQEQLKSLNKTIDYSNQKLQTTKKYLNKVKLSITIMETMEESESTNNILDCYNYIQQEKQEELQRKNNLLNFGVNNERHK